ncbi:MAG: LCP family protein [Candidatus Gracilibacteria bacterium]|nr:LCP family protein [Candidatus Gracilibacteria bacterium]
MFKKKKLKTHKKSSDFLKYINYIGFIILFLLSLIIIGKITNGEFKIFNNLLDNTQKELTIEEKNELKIIEEKKKLKLKEKEKKKKLEENKKRKKILDEKKQNILIIGRGGNGNDAPYLTDSILILSYYKEKKQISMMSIPRDLYVEYGDTNKNGKQIEAKINGLYVHYLAKYKDKKKAIKKLEEKVEEITGEKIDYYINLDFNGFIKLINSIDGITVNVAKNLYDEKYPDNNHGFQTFSLSKGVQKIYGQTALKYVRSRHNSGGDFGRSERQQQVVKSIKEKVLSSEYLASPSKIKELYDIFDKYIATNIGFIDFTKLATNLKLEQNLQFYSSTINASCIIKDECDKGGFLYYPQRIFFGGQSVLLSEGSDKNNLSHFEKIKEYSNILFNSPSLFKENFKISIFSKLEDKEEATELKQELKKYGLKINISERIGNIPEKIYSPIIPFSSKGDENKINIKNNITLEEYNKLKNKPKSELNINLKIGAESNNENTKIIINSVDINSNTIKFLKKYLQIKNTDIIYNIGGPKYAKDKNTKIEIIYKK